MVEKTFTFPEFAPDIAQPGMGKSGLISGVVPREDGYGPFGSFEEFSNALPAGCRGYTFARRGDGSIAVFAGTETRLYLLDNTTLQWGDVSKGGAAYPGLAPGSHWEFRQFNDFVLAVQVNTVPQKFVLSSAVAFVDLGGSPPQAAHIAIINRFVLLCGLASATRRVQWSDLDAPETWTAGVGLSDFQDLPDGGTLRAIAGGDMYGAIFQDESIRSLTYAPGSAATFQITRISTQDTLFATYSVAEVNGIIFFCSAQGFKKIPPGGVPVPIGKERVDRFFFGDVDTGNLYLMIAAPDPQSTRVYWAYKSKAGAAGLFDKLLCYDWGISQAGRWSLVPASGEYLASLARPGLTLEALDAIAPTPLDVLGAANNGAGLIRLTLNALGNADFTVVGQNFIRVYDVLGTVEANGTWAFTVVDATHIDLTGSAFANAYVGGGHIGGSLDALPFSLDSVSTASLAALSAFNGTHRAGFFTGAAIEAIMETDEADLEGRLVFVSAVRPLTDAADALISIRGRLTMQQVGVYTAESAIGDDGSCGQILETRYALIRLRIPAASTWVYARGVQPDAELAGDR